MPVNHQVGLTSPGLWAFLRQDPDKIMVRRSGTSSEPPHCRSGPDRASRAGTLHTNDAPGAITRLIDMGLEPFLLSASLSSFGQRRKGCFGCKQDYEPAKDLIENLGLNQNDIGERRFLRGRLRRMQPVGISWSNGLFEMIKVTDSFRKMIEFRARLWFSVKGRSSKACAHLERGWGSLDFRWRKYR